MSYSEILSGISSEARVALLSAFVGAILGALLTLITEWIVRRRERKILLRRNFQVALTSCLDAFEDFQNYFEHFTSSIIDREAILFPQVRELANFSIQEVSLPPEVSFSVADRKDKLLWTDVRLLIRRHKSTMNAVARLLEEKASLSVYLREAGYITNLSDGDAATYEFYPDDFEVVMQVTRVERLMRETLGLLHQNRAFADEVLGRLNASAKRKFMFKPPRVEHKIYVAEDSWVNDLEAFSFPLMPQRQVSYGSHVKHPKTYSFPKNYLELIINYKK